MYRSQLFVPGHHERRIENAINSEADAVILDLEDSVPPQEKEKARDTVSTIIKGKYMKPIVVRINDISTPFCREDIKCLLETRPEEGLSILIPKVEYEKDIHIIEWFVLQLEEEYKIDSGLIKFIPTIETARGLINIQEIAESSSRIKQIGYGMADLSSDLNLKWPNGGLEQLFSRMQVVITSRAANLDAPIDTVWPKLNDLEGLKKDAITAKELGFFGKAVIHPSQIEAVNEIFTPTQTEISEAQETLLAFEEAEKSGKGAIQLGNGQFIDYAFLKRSQDVLSLAKQLKLLN